jgi:hypothetical protein
MQEENELRGKVTDNDATYHWDCDNPVPFVGSRRRTLRDEEGFFVAEIRYFPKAAMGAWVAYFPRGFSNPCYQRFATAEEAETEVEQKACTLKATPTEILAAVPKPEDGWKVEYGLKIPPYVEKVMEEERARLAETRKKLADSFKDMPDFSGYRHGEVIWTNVTSTALQRFDTEIEEQIEAKTRVAAVFQHQYYWLSRETTNGSVLGKFLLVKDIRDAGIPLIVGRIKIMGDDGVVGWHAEKHLSTLSGINSCSEMTFATCEEAENWLLKQLDITPAAIWITLEETEIVKN